MCVTCVLTVVSLMMAPELAEGHRSATPRQVRAMSRWKAGLIVTIGLGLGLAISATALLPLSHALNGTLGSRPVEAAGLGA